MFRGFPNGLIRSACPQMASTTHNRGVKLNQPRIALVPLKKVLGIEPDNQRAQLELADAYLSLGNPEQAAIMYKKLSDSDPTNAKAWQGLGLTYAALSRLSFRHIEKSDPESPYRDELLGQSLLSRGQYQTAFYWYHQALVKDRSLPGAHAALAEIYRASGHP